jgi:hypothetical protein
MYSRERYFPKKLAHDGPPLRTEVWRSYAYVYLHFAAKKPKIQKDGIMSRWTRIRMQIHAYSFCWNPNPFLYTLQQKTKISEGRIRVYSDTDLAPGTPESV